MDKILDARFLMLDIISSLFFNYSERLKQVAIFDCHCEECSDEAISLNSNYLEIASLSLAMTNYYNINCETHYKYLMTSIQYRIVSNSKSYNH